MYRNEKKVSMWQIMTVLSQYIFGMLYLNTSVNHLLPVLFLQLCYTGKWILDILGVCICSQQCKKMYISNLPTSGQKNVKKERFWQALWLATKTKHESS